MQKFFKSYKKKCSLVTKINRRRRVKWAEAGKGWGQDDWADAIFSDECTVHDQSSWEIPRTFVGSFLSDKKYPWSSTFMF